MAQSLRLCRQYIFYARTVMAPLSIETTDASSMQPGVKRAFQLSVLQHLYQASICLVAGITEQGAYTRSSLVGNDLDWDGVDAWLAEQDYVSTAVSDVFASIADGVIRQLYCAKQWADNPKRENRVVMALQVRDHSDLIASDQQTSSGNIASVLAGDTENPESWPLDAWLNALEQLLETVQKDLQEY